MEKVLNNSKSSLKRRGLYLLLSVAAAVVLPQILHAAGVLTGTGAALGQALLPMYFPVILLGFCAGPAYGAAAGIISPILSFAVSGMPTAALLPFMTAELFCFGLFAGLLKNVRINFILKVLAVQLAARLVRLTAVWIISPSALKATVSALALGIPGIILQLLLVPFIVKKAERSGLC